MLQMCPKPQSGWFPHCTVLFCRAFCIKITLVMVGMRRVFSGEKILCRIWITMQKTDGDIPVNMWVGKFGISFVS